jgi:Cdc6-like AAA superfamily ATPase
MLIPIFGGRLEEDRRLSDLRRVIPGQCRPDYNPDRGCMDGTRVEILKEITDWAIDNTAHGHFLWLHGLAGSGKSSIAASVCYQLNKRADGRQYLGASFFCKRDDKYLRHPTLVLPKIAADLSNSFPQFAKIIAAALSDDPNLATTEAMTRQFADLFKGPLVKLSKSNRDPFVIVVDALDEMGTDDDRRRLITILYEMSELTPWLKIILTSRPDPDIRRFFDRRAQKF